MSKVTFYPANYSLSQSAFPTAFGYFAVPSAINTEFGVMEYPEREFIPENHLLRSLQSEEPLTHHIPSLYFPNHSENQSF